MRLLQSHDHDYLSDEYDADYALELEVMPAEVRTSDWIAGLPIKDIRPGQHNTIPAIHITLADPSEASRPEQSSSIGRLVLTVTKPLIVVRLFDDQASYDKALSVVRASEDMNLPSGFDLVPARTLVTGDKIYVPNTTSDNPGLIYLIDAVRIVPRSDFDSGIGVEYEGSHPRLTESTQDVVDSDALLAVSKLG